MTTLMFYEKPVGLDREAHKNKKIAPSSSGFKFASKTNSIVLACVEFVEAAKEYPIVFAKVSDDSAVPVALVGLRNDENVFVDADGKWDARYIPAFVRRYPFVLAEGDKNQFTVCVDEAYAGFGETDGQAMFDEKGENTPFLQNALDFLNNYQAQLVATQNFVKTLQKHDLLEEMNANVAMASGEEYRMGGLLVVNEKKLKALAPKKIVDLFQSNDLAWIYAHLMSLGNMNRLADRMSGAKA